MLNIMYIIIINNYKISNIEANYSKFNPDKLLFISFDFDF